MSGYKDDKHNPFDEQQSMTVEEADAAIFGAVDVPASGRMVAKPIAIETIIPDIRQPRKVVPSAVRRLEPVWMVEPQVAINHWHQLAEEARGGQINIHEGIMSYGNGPEEDRSGGVLVESFYSLMALAASIQRDGLINPITVMSATRKTFLISTGERRWWAHHLLAAHGYDDFARIPARLVDKLDVWEQAAENGRRKPLNAIGTARQLALLIMDLYQHEKDVFFYDIDDPLMVGKCNREFYAQVANGNLYRIPKNQGQRILDVTGIASMPQLRKYRMLLSIDDDLWQEADDGDWAEGKIRMELQSESQTIGRWVETDEPDDVEDKWEELCALMDSFVQSVERFQGRILPVIDIPYDLRSVWVGKRNEVIRYFLDAGVVVVPDASVDTWWLYDNAERVPERWQDRAHFPKTARDIDDPTGLIEKLDAIDPDFVDALVEEAQDDQATGDATDNEGATFEPPLIIEEHPQELLRMLLFVHGWAVRDVVGHHSTLVTKLGWLMDMNRVDLAKSLDQNGGIWLKDWMETTRVEICDYADDLVTSFKAELEDYMNHLLSIGVEEDE